jgi:hypothetical protein
MYHKSNLGQFAREVEHYADLNGYVPESETDLDSLTYDDPEHCLRDDRNYRLAFVEDAQSATERANELAVEWQKASA